MKYKIAVLHGAKLNAGDFLIKDRAVSLLRHFYPDCEITEYYRNQSLDDRITELNSHDIMIFTGGPGYFGDFYPGLAPFVENLDDIKIPMMILGMGWFGENDYIDTIYNYGLAPKMLDFLHRVKKDTDTLGCRDYFSVDVLRNNGIDTGYMTGCPAWYDLNLVDIVKYDGPKLNEVKHICVSDCANEGYYPVVLSLLCFLKKFFTGSKITYVCHRDDTLDRVGARKEIESMGIEILNISESGAGFSVYDNCDIHIGFRVHAHIYNLSERKLSILIEEDGRGAGVNQALGLPRICAYKLGAKEGSLIQQLNNYVTYQVEDYLFNMVNDEYMHMNNAYLRMNQSFEKMKKHILTIPYYIEKTKNKK